MHYVTSFFSGRGAFPIRRLFALLTSVTILSTSALLPDARAQVRILPLGDSITQGRNTSRPSYRPPLWQRLHEAGYAVDFVGSLTAHFQEADPDNDYDLDHEGHWGWRAEEILSGCDDCSAASGTGMLSDWLEDYTPDIVLVHLGTNDLGDAGEDEVVIEQTLDELGQIIDVLRADNPDVTVLLAQLIPSTSSPRDARIPLLNAQIPDLAAEKDQASSPVVVVDQYTGFDVNTDTYDGTHPDASGDQKMADTWFEALEALLEVPLPAVLSSFEATAAPDQVRLRWTTTSEPDQLAFEVERSGDGASFAPIARLDGRGPGAHYRYADAALPFGSSRLYYRLKQIELGGSHSYSTVLEVNLGPPERFTLQSNHPNPFREQTTIRYAVPERAQAMPLRLAIYDVLGREVAVLAEGLSEVGRHQVTWEAGQLPSGVYLCRLEAGGQVHTRTMLLVK